MLAKYVDVVVVAMDDSSAFVREAAVRALGRLDRPELAAQARAHRAEMRPLGRVVAVPGPSW